MVRWVIWYADGSSFTSIDGGPEDAPRLYVICIVVARQSCGRYVLAEQNFYCWHFDTHCWVPHDANGRDQYLSAPGIQKVVLSGYWVDRDLYTKIRSHALKGDDRLPPVTAGPPRQPEGESS